MVERVLEVKELVPFGSSTEAGAEMRPLEDAGALMEMYEGRVFRFLLFSLRDRDAAMSLTQDTFLNAWRYRESFRGECSVATWLMRIAVSLLRSHTRTETFKFWKRAAASSVDAMEMQSVLAHPGSTAEAGMAARQELAKVWDAVDGLSKGQRTVFLMRFVEEMELSEIAEATGMALPTVKSHLYRALDKVRAVARDEGSGTAKNTETKRERRSR
jgi:RNA polymerase sigma-70 factor (ECF subfamily)